MATIEVFATADASRARLHEIRLLMDAAFKGGFDDEDWEHTLGGTHVVAVKRQLVLAHAAVVPRTLTVGDLAFAAAYVEGVATLPDRQGHGLGSAVMEEANRIITESFELGALSTGEHYFYERLGWLRWEGPTYARDGSGMVRTEEDDDGIMVLLTGASRDVTRTEPIVCQSRPGDDW